MRATSVIAFAAAVAPAALAGPYFTSPVASTSCEAGKPCTISWQDDGKAPTLTEFGDATIGVFAGSQQQQSLMQAVAPANAQTTGTVTFVPDPNMGENSSAYFIKMVSINLADPAMPQYKASAYSAMFTLTGMTGKFNSTVQAQIAGSAASSGAAASGAPATTAAAAGTTSAAGSSAAATGASTGSAARASSSSTTRTGTTSAANAAASTNAASPVAVAGMGMFGATVLAALAAIF